MNRFFFLAVLLKGLVQLEVFVQLLGDLSNAGLVIAAASAELPVQVLARPEPVELGHGFGVVGKNLAVNLKKYLKSCCPKDPKLEYLASFSLMFHMVKEIEPALN